MQNLRFGVGLFPSKHAGDETERYYAEWKYYKDQVKKGETWNRGLV